MIVEKLIIVFILAISIVLHECAHGFIALLRGDATAKEMGRLTLNPIPHIDPFGTIILPFSLIVFGGPVFAYAKAVPINPYRLKNPKRDMMLIGAAGPITNLILAVFSGMVMRNLSVPGVQGYTGILIVLQFACIINLCLFLVNLLPIPPLDGSRIIAGILPNQYLKKFYALEPYGFYILILLLFAGFFEKVLWPVLLMLYGLILGV